MRPGGGSNLLPTNRRQVRDAGAVGPHVTRLVIAEGTGIRAKQRKVSRKIIHLLGSDPTKNIGQ
jgi:hypothetical protein